MKKIGTGHAPVFTLPFLFGCPNLSIGLTLPFSMSTPHGNNPHARFSHFGGQQYQTGIAYYTGHARGHATIPTC